MSISTALIRYKNKFLLFHRDNIAGILDPDCWQLPGGHVEEGESALAAIKRELFEEISYCPEGLVYVGARELSKDNFIYLFYADISESEKFKFAVGNQEGQEIGFFGVEEALGLNLTRSLREYINHYKTQIDILLETGVKPEPADFDLKNIA